MKLIQWLVSLVPVQARSIVAVLLIAISALTGTIVFLYKDKRASEIEYTTTIHHLSEFYQKKTDSLTNIILLEKEKSKQEVISRLEKIIEEQKGTLTTQARHKKEQTAVIRINNTIIQQNTQRIKQLRDE
jgi:hypothetical protein